MNNPWTPEYVVSPQLAASLIEEQFPNLSPVQVRPLGDGWDNTAFYVNDSYVFRFPRREMAAESIQIENRILPGIAHLLPVPVPIPLFIGKAGKDFRWTFSGYPMLSGKTACISNLNEAQRINLAAPIAGFLKALHNIPLDLAVSLGAGPDKIGRLDLARRIPKLHACLEDASSQGLIDDITPLIQIIKTSAVKRSKDKLTLVHGDLYARHILVDCEANISGVIDWGDVHIGDPALDISIVHGFLPQEGRDIFRKTYGNIDEETWCLARFKALYLAVILLLYGHDIKDDALLRESKRYLNLVVKE